MGSQCHCRVLSFNDEPLEASIGFREKVCSRAPNKEKKQKTKRVNKTTILTTYWLFYELFGKCMRIRWVNVYEEATLKLICRHHIPFLPRSRMFDAQSFGENDKTRADQKKKKLRSWKTIWFDFIFAVGLGCVCTMHVVAEKRRVWRRIESHRRYQLDAIY